MVVLLDYPATGRRTRRTSRASLGMTMIRRNDVEIALASGFKPVEVAYFLGISIAAVNKIERDRMLPGSRARRI